MQTLTDLRPEVRRGSYVILACAALVWLSACGDDGDGQMTGPEPTTGAVLVDANTSGGTPDEDGYSVSVADADSKTVAPNGSAIFTGLSEGEVEVEATGLQVNCETEQSNPQTGSVTAGDTTTVALGVTCPTALLDQLAFASDRDGNFELYAVETDGFPLTRLTRSPEPDFHPDVSPDGTSIVYSSGGSVATVDADRSGKTSITDGRLPEWSPDGSRIVFQSFRDGDSDIYTVAPDGSSLQQVTDDSASDAAPSWSPDGSRIVFQSDRDGDRDIYTIAPDGSGLQQVTNDTLASDAFPDWSPDGSRIAFQSNRDGDREIYTINPDGSNLQKVTDNSMDERHPSWSPNGDRIAFSSNRAIGSQDHEIYTINPTGTEPTAITGSSGEDFVPAWGPPR